MGRRGRLPIGVLGSQPLQIHRGRRRDSAGLPQAGFGIALAHCSRDEILLADQRHSGHPGLHPVEFEEPCPPATESWCLGLAEVGFDGRRSPITVLPYDRTFARGPAGVSRKRASIAVAVIAGQPEQDDPDGHRSPACAVFG